MRNHQFQHDHYDAIIIGARCSGSATALGLARAGARVLLVDRDLPENDTLSTHALMRPAIMLLHDWGVLREIEKADTPLVQVANFHYGSEKVSVSIKPENGVNGLFAPRRYILDQILAESAVKAGAELHTGVEFQTVVKDTTGRVRGAVLSTKGEELQTVSTDMLIGADGRMSTVAREVGARTLIESPKRTAVVYGYFHGLANEGYRWFFGQGSYGGAIPTNNGAHCVFAGTPRKDFRATFAPDALEGVINVIGQCDPALSKELPFLPQIGRFRRFAGAPGHIRECVGRGWALVGDAGYFKDPATAHGITDALLDADRLTRALTGIAGHVADYETERNKGALPLLQVTRRIASLNWDYEELKALHMDLNTCIKEEQIALASRLNPLALAS